MEEVIEVRVMPFEKAKVMYIIEIQHRYKVEGLLLLVVFTLPYLMPKNERDAYVDYIKNALDSEFTIVRTEKIDILFEGQEERLTRRFCGMGKESLIIYDSPQVDNPEIWIAKSKTSWYQYRTTLDVYYGAYTEIGKMLIKNLGVFVNYPAEEESEHGRFIDKMHQSLGAVTLPIEN